MMCTHEHCRNIAAAYWRAKADETAKTDPERADLMRDEAARCIDEMVVCKLPPKDE